MRPIIGTVMQNRNRFRDVKKGYFKSITKIFHMGLSSSEIAVYCYLCSCTEEFNPSVRVIARYCRLSKDTVSDALGSLQRRGMIRLVVQGQRGQSARYAFIHPDKWGNDGEGSTAPNKDIDT